MRNRSRERNNRKGQNSLNRMKELEGYRLRRGESGGY